MFYFFNRPLNFLNVLLFYLRSSWTGRLTAVDVWCPNTWVHIVSKIQHRRIYPNFSLQLCILSSCSMERRTEQLVIFLNILFKKKQTAHLQNFKPSVSALVWWQPSSSFWDQRLWGAHHPEPSGRNFIQDRPTKRKALKTQTLNPWPVPSLWNLSIPGFSTDTAFTEWTLFI